MLVCMLTRKGSVDALLAGPVRMTCVQHTHSAERSSSEEGVMSDTPVVLPRHDNGCAQSIGLNLADTGRVWSVWM